jgi:hypothetical protein
MGLPGKPKGFDGGEVERYFHEGKIKEIADYCETDIVNTYPVVAAVRAVSRHAERECVRGERAELCGLHKWALKPQIEAKAGPQPLRRATRLKTFSFAKGWRMLHLETPQSASFKSNRWPWFP